jgi:hypothetical protein
MMTNKEKKWPSLTAFKDFLEANSKEKVIEFNGYRLVTNKFEYQLFDGQISKTKLK